MRALLLLALLVAGTAVQTPGQAPDPDEAAVRAVMSDMREAWLRHDMKAWTSYMTDDVQWVNIVGMWWHGKDEVFRAHDTYHRTIFKDRSFPPPDTVVLRHVAPDTVIANIEGMTGAFTSPSGVYRPAARNILTEVFVKHDGQWLLTAGQNTVVDEAAQKSNPITPK